jgi:pimeloyl-ACP methyl ester carboxylesterase
VTRAALEGTLDAVAPSFMDRVGAIAIPTLVVGGSGDPMFGPELLETAVVAPLADARLELLDCGHEIPIEAPQELAALIAAFLAS